MILSCISCGSDLGQRVRAGVFDGAFAGTLAEVLLAAVLIVALALALAWWERPRAVNGVVRAGTWLGIGMGGFVDGILFHQLL